ncbi:MAG: hypothetical protein AAFO91_04345 [Bacteroidota bacterium]
MSIANIISGETQVERLFLAALDPSGPRFREAPADVIAAARVKAKAGDDVLRRVWSCVVHGIDVGAITRVDPARMAAFGNEIASRSSAG